jgi:ABC-type nitrate/sulfonate/bicarbonate transport system substrate-binding protein
MTRREPLVAFLKAYKRGAQCMLDHPDEASQLEKVERTSRELRLTKNTLEVQRLSTNELVQAL